MFASAAFSGPTHGQAGMYRQTQVSSIVDSASPHRLVAMLFDGFMEAVAQARGAMAARNIELKGRSINRAIGIVEEGLKGGLNLQDGGDVALNLHQLYSYISVRLTQANLKNSDAALEECQRLMESVKSAWAEIKPTT